MSLNVRTVECFLLYQKGSLSSLDVSESWSCVSQGMSRIELFRLAEKWVGQKGVMELGGRERLGSQRWLRSETSMTSRARSVELTRR